MKRCVAKLACLLLTAAALTLTAGAEDASTYMTYRQNAVELTAAEGLAITSGSFVVTEFSITGGQDPDGKNQVGQTHVLEDGAFTFEAGRSGSEAVADWFNSRFSGYNDPAVNGDRTTFDQAAGKLNFAFVGDLSLVVTSAEYPQGLSVTFPGAAFAQGSTGLRNNWWFAQLTGQHTRDGDGPDTLLAFGSTPSGETVFASFLRGGNGVSEVSLEAIAVAEPARERPYEMADVPAAFQRLPVDGSLCSLEGFPGSYDPTVNHIQGYSLYNSRDGFPYVILTHSVSSAPYAHIVAGPKLEDAKWGFKTYLRDWRHPGGIQAIGDYVLVPSEHDSSAHIALYDLRTLAVEELRRVEGFDLAVDHKAGALGVTSYKDAGGTEYYVLVVAHLDNENSVYHVYRAPAADGIEAAEFTEVGSFPYEKDFQGFGLVTEEDTNDVYMIGLWSPSEGATFADYAYLYRLDTDAWSIGEALDSIHMVSTGGLPGVMGVHFRYGAGTYVDQSGLLTVSATERNSVLGSSLATNDWSPAPYSRRS